MAVLARWTTARSQCLPHSELRSVSPWWEPACICRSSGVKTRRAASRRASPVEDRVFKSKSTLALELITHLRGIGVQFAATALDAGYGKEPGLLRALDDAGEVFVVEVHSSQRIWRDDPWPAAHLPGTSRRASGKLHAVGTALSVRDWAETQPPAAWRTVALRQGTQGELRVEFIHQRVYLCDSTESGSKLWHLMARRTLEA